MSSPMVTAASGAPLVSLVTTAETVALATPVLPYNAPGAQGMQVNVCVNGATGASVTSCQVRVYRGATAAGTLLGVVFQEAQGASSFYAMSGTVLDTAPGAAPQYCVTVQQVAATGNGTVTQASISAEAATASGA